MATTATLAKDVAGAAWVGQRARATPGLQAVNFFMADMQAGIGPFLGVFLQQRGWAPGPTGTVMTVGGVSGMLMTAPAGAFIDHTTKTRWVVVITGSCTVLASFLILDGGSRVAMRHSDGVWLAEIAISEPGVHRIEVVSGDGRDAIDVLVREASALPRRGLVVAPGHACHALGAWPVAGIEGMQLGPNKNGAGW